jgi:hypothetical protein
LLPIPAACDPKFVLKTDPATAPKNVPWSEKNLTIKGVVRAAAFTGTCFSVDCTCQECTCPGFCEYDQELECTVNMSFHIFLDFPVIQMNEVLGDGSITRDSMYGHEQRHVQNYIREMNLVLTKFQNELIGTGCIGSEDCRSMEDTYEDKIRAAFQIIKGKNNRHDYKEPKKGLTPYKPIGGRPTKPGAPNLCHIESFEDSVRDSGGDL